MNSDASTRTRNITHAYLTLNVFKVVLQKSTPPQICQLILHIGDSKGQVDEFVCELALAKRLSTHFVSNTHGSHPFKLVIRKISQSCNRESGVSKQGCKRGGTSFMFAAPVPNPYTCRVHPDASTRTPAPRHQQLPARIRYRGTSLIRNTRPPTTIGPWTQGCCKVLRGEGFSRARYPCTHRCGEILPSSVNCRQTNPAQSTVPQWLQ